MSSSAFNDDDPDRGCCSSWLPLENVLASTNYMIQITPLDSLGDTARSRSAGGRSSSAPGSRLDLRDPRPRRRSAGLGGNDVITGGNGADLIFGGPGNDRWTEGRLGSIFDRHGVDILRGSGGLDVLDARDRHAGRHPRRRPGPGLVQRRPHGQQARLPLARRPRPFEGPQPPGRRGDPALATLYSRIHGL